MDCMSALGIIVNMHRLLRPHDSPVEGRGVAAALHEWLYGWLQMMDYVQAERQVRP